MASSSSAIVLRRRRQVMLPRGERLCPPRSCLAAIATRRWRCKHVLPGACPQSAVAAGGGRVARAARGVQVCHNGVTPMAAHTCAARRLSSAGRGWGGQSRRTSCTGHAGLAAIATRRWRHTRVLPGAGSPPAVAGEGSRIVRAARGVQVSQRSRRANGGTH